LGIAQERGRRAAPQPGDLRRAARGPGVDPLRVRQAPRHRDPSPEHELIGEERILSSTWQIRYIMKIFAYIAAFFALSAVLCGPLRGADMPRKPNIVMVFIDDMGWGD